MLEVNPETGRIKLNFPHLDAMTETCSLDVADRVATLGRELSLNVIGLLLGRTGERARQHEAAGRLNLIEAIPLP